MSGWFPHFNRNGDVASGQDVIWINGEAVLIDGQPIHGIGPHWLDQNRILYTSQIDGTLRMLWRGLGNAWTDSLIRMQSGDGIATKQAFHDRWAIFRTDPVRIIYDDETEVLGLREPTFCQDGPHMAALRQDGGALIVDVQSNIIWPSEALNPNWGHTGTTLMWEYHQRIFGVVTPGQTIVELTIPRLHCYKPVPIWTGTELWFLCHEDGRVLLAPWGQSRGYVLTEDITDGPHDAVAIDTGFVLAAWSVKGALPTIGVDFNSPRVELSPPVQVPVPPVTPTPPDNPEVPEEPPMTEQEKVALVNLCATPCPQDVMLAAIDSYLTHVLERDKCGDSMSRGALMFFIPNVSAEISRNLGMHGLPHGTPEQIAGGWNSYAAAGVSKAVAAYEHAVNPQ